MIPAMGRGRTQRATPDLFSTTPFGETSPPTTKQVSAAPEPLRGKVGVPDGVLDVLTVLANARRTRRSPDANRSILGPVTVTVLANVVGRDTPHHANRGLGNCDSGTHPGTPGRAARPPSPHHSPWLPMYLICRGKTQPIRHGWSSPRCRICRICRVRQRRASGICDSSQRIAHTVRQMRQKSVCRARRVSSQRNEYLMRQLAAHRSQYRVEHQRAPAVACRLMADVFLVASRISDEEDRLPRS
jgi:hypothetical protein